MAVATKKQLRDWIQYLESEDEEAIPPDGSQLRNKALRDSLLLWVLSAPGAELPPLHDQDAVAEELEKAQPEADKVGPAIDKLQYAYGIYREPNILGMIAYIAFNVGFEIRAIVACNQARLHKNMSNLTRLVHMAIFVGLEPQKPLPEFQTADAEVQARKSRQLSRELKFFYEKIPVENTETIARTIS